MHRVFLFAFVFAGCAPRTPAETAVPAPGDGAQGAPVGVEQAGTGCPTSFVRAQMATCILQEPRADACAYPNGRCICVEPSQCGGAHMNFPPGSLGVWSCTPTNPDTAARADGCPWLTPAKGSECQGDRSCTYGACSYAQTVATCQGGKWNVVFRQLPVPP